MKSALLFSACLFLSFSTLSHAEILKISVTKDVEIPKVKAQVTIVDGAVIQSNCDTLTNTNSEGIKYKLTQDGMSFFCSPNPAKRRVTEIRPVDAGMEITQTSLNKLMADLGKAYELEEGKTKGFFTNQSISTPSCRLNGDGSVDFSTCVCNSEFQTFDKVTKVCINNSSILSFYANSCSDRSTHTKTFLESFGANVFPPPSVTFGMCGVELNHFHVLPNDLIAKAVFFAYNIQGIKKAVNVDRDARVKLVITKAQADEMIAWGKTWARSEDAQKFPAEVRERAEKLDTTLEYVLDEFIEIVNN